MGACTFFGACASPPSPPRLARWLAPSQMAVPRVGAAHAQYIESRVTGGTTAELLREAAVAPYKRAVEHYVDDPNSRRGDTPEARLEAVWAELMAAMQDVETPAETVLETISQARALLPTSVSLITKQADTIHHQGRTQEAEALLSSSIRWPLAALPPEPSSAAISVWKLMRPNRPPFRIIPGSIALWDARCIMMSSLERYPEAAVHYDTALAMDPASPWVHINRGYVPDRPGGGRGREARVRLSRVYASRRWLPAPVTTAAAALYRFHLRESVRAHVHQGASARQ